ncbi:class I SAM-dependent methyltransferase [Ectobacillus panaciterrae]|uniref:class I SAM-dependent methyltransferase n=1 Tax=Ectobacillus panaciterrae TaxID=363872 RepID=UPI000429B44D|nr:class I SAM-dependent methyltransferase [Ectobacillus panaciterrae]
MVNHFKSNSGYCVICEKETTFIEYGEWLRDCYLCKTCGSIPRQRALINVLNIFFQNWKGKIIHESSPAGATTQLFSRTCKNYTASQYFNNIPLGQDFQGTRCENLECMTFSDDSFDIFITQDVFEHVMNPEKAFKEIKRVLKSGGVHIFTVPWYHSSPATVQRARVDGDSIEYLKEPIYHGNPIDPEGSLVTFDWGMDLIEFIYKHTNMCTIVYLQKEKALGLEAEFLHVFISRKI